MEATVDCLVEDEKKPYKVTARHWYKCLDCGQNFKLKVGGHDFLDLKKYKPAKKVESGYKELSK